jgi:5-methylcytosine-specific restriction protein A
MKLMNFRRFDPSYQGKGLQRGNKDEQQVWNLYADRLQELRRVATAILSFVNTETNTVLTNDFNEDAEAEEGRILTRVHLVRERNSKIVDQKKAHALTLHGRLACEVCGFDFERTYRDCGAGFMECHHTKPLSQLQAGERTKLYDLALVCSNCHRMIHRRKPWLTIEALKTALTPCPAVVTPLNDAAATMSHGD